jgi:hypothetical protein
MPPAEVNFTNAAELRQRLKLKRIYPPKRPSKFRIGDHVRTIVHKDVFTKGYMPNFSEEIYTISKVRSARHPYTYRLLNGKGVPLRGLYYAEELSRVQLDPRHLWQIKILESVTRGGKRYHLVEWRGTRSKKWLPETSPSRSR